MEFFLRILRRLTDRREGTPKWRLLCRRQPRRIEGAGGTAIVKQNLRQRILRRLTDRREGGLFLRVVFLFCVQAATKSKKYINKIVAYLS